MLIWQGFSFELLCLLHLEQLKYKLHIDVISNHSSSWRSSDPDNPAQIDLVIERGDRIINLCEMKFASSPYTIDKNYEMRLRERIGLFVHQTHTRCGIHITMVTTFGTVPNSHYHSIVNSEVCLEDLFTYFFLRRRFQRRETRGSEVAKPRSQKNKTRVSED